MARQFTLLLLSAFSQILLAQQSAPPIPQQRLADYEYLSAPDSAGKRIPLKMPPKIDDATPSQHAQLPYPIIFVHGLNSCDTIWNYMTDFWDTQYGTIYGGSFDFCLNYDGDYTTANLNFADSSNSSGADLAFFKPTLINGDYYYVNFDVGSNGMSLLSYGEPYYVESNQAAVFKQGLALKWAIYYVLQETGKDKVILMGHSMGGLAARQYLQNSNLWQPDGQHHVAKLITTGTPHGGSNASVGGFLDGIFAGIDDQSEAVRDLRTSYSYGPHDPGVYLFGGIESNAVMDDLLLDNFYNVDVNCDGIIGKDIVGLNQKEPYLDLDYSCIIGECTTCPLAKVGGELPGDGVVGDVSANLNNYYHGLKANLFYYYNTGDIEIHTELPYQIIQNMQGLDEPDNYNLAYYIGFDTIYLGFTTFPDTSDPNYPTDFDDYKFSLPVTSIVTVTMNNITLPDLYVHIRDSSLQIVGNSWHSNGSSSINFTDTLYAGNYYLGIFGTAPDVNSHISYHFLLSKSGVTTGVDGFPEKPDFQIYPNPTSNELIIKTDNFQPQFISVYDINGRKVIEAKFEAKLDVSILSSGMYFIELKSQNGTLLDKFIKL